MLTFEESIRFVRIQERLRIATFHEIRKDGGHKSSEGAMSISFVLPPVLDDDRSPYWTVEAYSYLLNPEGRIKRWSGKTASEAISKAEDGVESWCHISEMESFGEAMGFNKDTDSEFYYDYPNPANVEAQEASNFEAHFKERGE